MHRIRDLKNGLYQIHSLKSQAYEGSKNQIIKKALTRGLAMEELVAAFLDLEMNDDDYAEFGIMGTYMFTARDRKTA